MKIYLFFVAMILTIFVGVADAQKVSGYVEQENEAYVVGSTDHYLNIWVTGGLKGRLSWSAWSQTTKTWSETLAGLTFAPAKWVELTGLVGIETDKRPLRYNGTGYFTKWRFSYLTIQENGGSGYWQRNIASMRVNNLISVGALQQTEFGSGPYIEINPTKRFMVYGGLSVHKKVALLVGRFNF